MDSILVSTLVAESSPSIANLLVVMHTNLLYALYLVCKDTIPNALILTNEDNCRDWNEAIKFTEDYERYFSKPDIAMCILRILAIRATPFI